jgi:hypothetical protein
LSQDAPVQCSQIRTQAACDQRSDCHSVNFASEACGCSTPGCCTTFDQCADGGAVACNGRVTCPDATPFCEAPYVVQYLGDCFGVACWPANAPRRPVARLRCLRMAQAAGLRRFPVSIKTAPARDAPKPPARRGPGVCKRRLAMP